MEHRPIVILLLILLLGLAGACDTYAPEDPGLLVPLTVEEDSSLPSIAVNGTLLHAETYGDANDPMLVIIHGGPGADYRSMLSCADLANDGYYVVFYDQRGCGLSQRHKADVYTTQLFIDDLDAVIHHYRQSPDQAIFLLGHSWGAMLATAYINENPSAISGAILAEPGGFTWDDTKAYVERFQAIDVFSELTNDMVYLDQLMTADDHRMLDYKGGLLLDYSLVGDPGPYPSWRFGAVCNQAALEYVEEHPFDFRTNLEQYTTKVLFAYSELNPAYGPEHAMMVSSAFPSVELVRIDDTGHEIPYFGWEQFYPLVKAYLEEF